MPIELNRACHETFRITAKLFCGSMCVHEKKIREESCTLTHHNEILQSRRHVPQEIIPPNNTFYVGGSLETGLEPTVALRGVVSVKS